MQRNYANHERERGGNKRDSRCRGVADFWRRVIENSDDGRREVPSGGWVEPRLESVGGREREVELRFGLGEPGRDFSRWRVESVEVLSLRSGAKSVWAADALRQDADSGGVARVFLPVTAEEPVCRLRVEFTRVAGFTAEELWCVAPLDLPANGGSRATVPASTTVDGATVRLHSLTAPGGVVPGEFQELWNQWTGDSGVFTLWVEVSPEGMDRRLTLVSAVDELGRQAEVRTGLWSGEQYAFGLVPPAGAKTLRFTFALHRSRVEEFVVDTTIGSGHAGQHN
ncbi:MAG: hypothetical protein AB7O66_22345 [Limisphaerales bacterium]